MEQKNRFSALLEHLVAVAEVKHYALAQSLQFDVSYISKWINGRVLPSEKNISEILRKLSQSIVANAGANGMTQLLQDYRVKNTEELWQAIYDNLIAEYYYVQELQQNSGNIVAPNVSYYAELPLKRFLSKMHHPVLRRVKSLNIMAAVDLFAMESEYRLQVVSLGDQQAMGHMYPDVHFSLLINLNQAQKDIIGNTLFITQMLLNLACVDFKLYRGDFAYGKVMFVVQDEFAISGMLVRKDNCASVAICEGRENTLPLYNTIQTMCTRDALLFHKMDMQEMLTKSMDYLHSLLAPSRCWVLGHFTEHLLPDNLYAQLLEESGIATTEKERANLLQLHDATKRVIQQGALRLLLSETALSILVVSGTVDFFNRKFTLTYEQRMEVILSLRQLLQSPQTLQLRLTQDALLSEFQNGARPSLFLSGTVAYLRLETENREENLILKINGQDMRALYQSFFDRIWNSENGVVTDLWQVDAYVDHLMQGLQMLTDTKQ